MQPSSANEARRAWQAMAPAVLAAALAGVTGACAQPPAAPAPPAQPTAAPAVAPPKLTAPAASLPKPGTPAASPPTLAAVERLIGRADCDADAQCRVAPIGWRSCGGPASFKAWSVGATSAQQLQQALDAHLAHQKDENERLGLMSTCQVLPVPIARCEPATRRCVLAPAQSGLR